jgi:hypothetical protein
VTGTDPYVEKVLHAAQQAFAERELLREENKEKRTRKHIRERKIGDAKVMSFEDIVKARKSYDLAQAEKERKRNKLRRKGKRREEKGEG